MKIYLAGPDVFLPDAAIVGQRKKDICARFGLEGLFPLDNEIAQSDGASLRIFRANTAMMDAADAVIANLTPFRGPSADPGTVYELGHMAGRGKLCLGYSNVAGTYLDRVRSREAVRRDEQRGRYFDDQGWIVEDFSLADNLMIVHALDEFGHALVLPREPLSDPARDLTAFEHCVRLIAARKTSLSET
jgi:nucleoside 2-deoxyribosyltransferase